MKNLFTLFILLNCCIDTYAQIGVKANNTPPIASAQLEVQSINKAFYPPRMTSQQRTSFPNPPQAGAMVFDTDLNSLVTYNGSSWVTSGLTLPYSVSQSTNNNLLSIISTNATTPYSAIRGETNSSSGDAISGIANNISSSDNTTGVAGFNYSTNSNGFGVFGYHNGAGSAIYGNSISGTGGYFTSPTGNALVTGSGNVGIGIPTPLEKLHVSGNIRASSLAGTGVRDVKANANGTLITTPQTYTISVAPQSFQPRYNTSGTFTSLGAYGHCYMSAGSTDNLIAGIQLPNGATITSVIVYYINTDNTKKFYVSLTGSPFTVSTSFSVFDGTTSTISASGNSIVSYSVPNSGGGSVINNSSNIYYFLIAQQTLAGVSTTWSANMSVKGVMITYTL